MPYDALGRQHLHISFDGVITEHVYSDTTGRLIDKRFFDNLAQYDDSVGEPGEVWTYTDDAFGRVFHVAAYLRDAGTGLLEPARSESTPNGNGTIDSRMLTELLNDVNNHTGYSQVLRESHYDADGQMLALWNASGQPLSGGSGQYTNVALAATTLLYAGEQFDPRIGHQYLRARYYDPTTARFTRLAPFFGNLQDPVSTVREITVRCPFAPLGRGQGEGAESASVISRTVLSDQTNAAWDGHRRLMRYIDRRTGLGWT